MTEHKPVMMSEVLSALEPWSDVKTVVDATLGLGGHTGEILRSCPDAHVIGFDQDPNAREIAIINLSEFTGRVTIEADNFRNIAKLGNSDGFSGADAVLFDLGVSNLQLTDSERGFSFQAEGPLDMRMDTTEERASVLTAGDILNSWSIKELTQLFRDFGEDPFAYQIARGIVRNREQGGYLNSTAELVEIIRRILPAPVQRKMGGHPARKIFQALRIAVNDEMSALNEALDGAIEILSSKGKIIAISYHSLEDRMVKKRFRKWQEEGLGEAIPRRAIVPTEAEIEANYKSRSAKLRIFQAMPNMLKKGGTENALQRIPT